MKFNESPNFLKACDEVSKIFSKPWNGENLANHQIRKAARITIDLIGTDWIILSDQQKDLSHDISIAKQKLKIAIKLPLNKWHKDPARVWRSFKSHSLEIASGREARKIIKNIRSN